MPEPQPEGELMTIKESYISDNHEEKKEKLQEEKKEENLNTKDSTDNSREVEEKSNLFISRTEEDEDFKVHESTNKHDYDVITELESKMSMTSRESYFDEIESLFLSEPSWHKSSSWVKPVPHRVYKIKTVWSEINKFDTEVHRRYRHFLWLRKMLIKENEH